MIKVLMQRLWRGFCQLAIKVFYRNFEVAGFAQIPTDQPVIFCANHANALVDPILVQAASSKWMRPLARSGLFEKLWLKPILSIIGAVPIYRAQDKGVDTAHNSDTFSRVYELLAQNEWIIIFPEGQSHSQSRIQTLKTGAARMALGSIAQGNTPPLLIPVGLTFTQKGKFRGDVLVYFGAPVDLSAPEKIKADTHVRLITRRLTQGLQQVTLNTQCWDDLELVAKVERFFFLRGGKYQQRKLLQRFKSLQRLLAKHRQLRIAEPERVEQLSRKLRQFEKTCRNLGIKDYHLNVSHKPWLVAWYCLKMVALLLLVLPLSLWALINSYLPYVFTQSITAKVAQGKDQYETSKILFGFIFFSLFWGVQTYLALKYFGATNMLIYIASLVASAMVAVRFQKHLFSIKENIYVFFLFLRNRGLKQHLLNKRRQLERELARLVRSANKLNDRR